MSKFRSAVAKAKSIHLIRFVVVGVLNTSFSYMIYSIFVFSGLGYQLANLLSLLVGILFSFKTQGRFVFNNRSNGLFGRFVLSWIFIYLCSIGIIGLIMRFGFDAYAAGALALPFNVGLSFVAQKYFVFRRPVDKISVKAIV